MFLGRDPERFDEKNYNAVHIYDTFSRSSHEMNRIQIFLALAVLIIALPFAALAHGHVDVKTSGTTLKATPAVFAGSTLVLTNPVDSALLSHAAVVRAGDSATGLRCSGVLIAPDVVLTAEHCTHQTIGLYVAFPIERLSARYAARQIVRFSEDQPTRAPRGDLALIFLDHAAPASMHPAILARTSPTIGEAVVAAANGFQEDSLSTPAIPDQPLRGDFTVFEIASGSFGVTSLTQGICGGDSGGPVYRLNASQPPDAQIELIGVTAYFKPVESIISRCSHRGHYTDLSFYADWIAVTLNKTDTI